MPSGGSSCRAAVEKGLLTRGLPNLANGTFVVATSGSSNEARNGHVRHVYVEHDQQPAIFDAALVVAC